MRVSTPRHEDTMLFYEALPALVVEMKPKPMLQENNVKNVKKTETKKEISY